MTVDLLLNNSRNHVLSAGHSIHAGFEIVKEKVNSRETQEIFAAKQIAFRFLKIRERSVFEMREILRRKEISQAIVEQTIAFLLDKKFLNDRVFAQHWIRYRQARPFGQRRIHLELRQKGIAEDMIVEELTNAFDQYDQQGVVLQLAQRRYGKIKNLDPLKSKKRIFDYLLRRGFAVDVINKAIRNL